MKKPSIASKIEAFCEINPSENPEKVKTAIINVLPFCDIKLEKFSIKAVSDDLGSLEKIQEAISAQHHQKIYKRTLEKNLANNSTWFYLNKQAAFANRIAICEKSDESPLGPIKITCGSNDINRIIEWLIL